MIWVYAEKPVQHDRNLATMLGGQLVRAFDGETFWVRGRRVVPASGDTVITMSGTFPKVANLTVFNGDDKESVDESRTLSSLLHMSSVLTPQLRDTPRDGWLGRIYSHKNAVDLINPPTHPEFWAEKAVVRNEFRIHVFQGKVIGVGQKVKASPFCHQWVRTEATGWHVDYGTKAELGRQLKSRFDVVMNATNVDFASIDLGETESHETIVFGMDRIPKLDTRVLSAYVRAFKGDLK